MTNRRRLLLLIFLAAALVGLTLLSMSLSTLPLQPGRPFYLGEPEQATPTPQGEAQGPDLWAVLEIILPLMVWVGLPLFIASIIWAIIRKKKGYLVTVLLLLGWAALVLYLQLNVMQNPQQLWQPPAAQTAAPTTPTPTPTDVFDPTTPEWLVYATSAGLTLLLLGIAWSLWQAWRRRPPRPLELVAEEAETALEAIAAGAGWQNAIVRCYAEMCQALHRARGLARRQATTPSEFAVQLEEAGLPGEHVQRLTRLFEIVRYGGRQARPEDEQEAMACLTAIVRFCRGEP